MVTLSLIDFHDLLKTVINEAMYFQTCQIYTINPKLLLVKPAWPPRGAPVSEQPPGAYVVLPCEFFAHWVLF